MARIIPVGFAEASLVFTGGGGTPPYVQTIGVAVTAVDPADYVTAANDILNIYMTNFDSLLSDSITLERVDLAIGLAGGESGSVTSDTLPQNGNRSSSSTTWSMCPVLQKLSAELGRRGRGRCFGVGLLEPAQVLPNGEISVGQRLAIQVAWSGFLTDLATLGVGEALAPVILHTDGSTPTPITGGRVATHVGYIRDRT